MLKPSNCQDIIRDHIVISPVLDLSAASAFVNPPFVDTDLDHQWEVVGVGFYVTTAYIAANAAEITVGQGGTTNKFLNAATLGVGAVAVETIIDLTSQLTATRLLTPGRSLEIGHVQEAGQTGEGFVAVRLRPHDVKYGASKRPAAAQSPA